jgi:hypothetical protein
MNPARDICDLLQTRASSGRDASWIVETVFAKITAILRRDPRFATITRSEFEVLLADVSSETEKLLFSKMRDRIHIDDAEDTVRCCLGDE